MTGIELAAGAAVGYLVRKLRRVGNQANAEVDRALEAGMDAIHDLVTVRLGPDPALATLTEQVPTGLVNDRTLRRVTDAVTDAAEADPAFAERLKQLVDDLQKHEGGVTNVTQQAKASGHGRVYQAGRDQTINEQ
ncbi:hypothetical protein GCM10022254_67250 [Actinomadura meridiana]|uniref:Chromosome partitioning protein n=1 Tax=Actinomadura meridiana TaxID=559626 RepID=A0ABP8CLR0_9ACTN